MSKDGKDPFSSVDAKSVTEIELDHGVKLDREPLPPAAQLTNLPLKWVFLMLMLCLGANMMVAHVERSQLISAAEDKGLITESEAEDARAADRIVDQREEYRDRLRELKQRRAEFERLRNGSEDDIEATEKVSEPDGIPLTLETLREDLIERAGDKFPTYQRAVTVFALVIGGLGLIVLALFIRILGAAVLGGGAFAGTWFVGVEPQIMWAATGVGALAGLFFAPRLLLANMLINSAIAMMLIGGILAGGGVYISTGDELYSMFALGGGAVLGAIFGIKYARQLFLSAVLANCAGMATLALWLMWGEIYANFWPLTFGALMIFDGVATRIYHKVRWARS
ncbi:MAG: hypothetical protein L3J82_10385 [Planctomycetes bacterium]|nr:hypothetical protein [Planctomycetota bacterium]